MWTTGDTGEYEIKDARNATEKPVDVKNLLAFAMLKIQFLVFLSFSEILKLSSKMATRTYNQLDASIRKNNSGFPYGI